MLTGRTILCLATQPWNAHWTPVQQVMVRLAESNRVIYVEPFHPPLTWLRPGSELLRRERRLPRLREVAPGVAVYRPGYPYLPGNMRASLPHRINGTLFKAEIAALLGRLGVRRPILWAFFAQSLRVLELDYEQVIYDCVDEWPAFFTNPVQRRWVAHVDEAMCRRADVLFVGSQPLLERKRGLNAEVHVVTHAADTPHFETAAAEATVVPEDLARIPSPRIGFVGMMDDIRFDTDIIGRLSRTSGRQIVLIGGFMGRAAQLIPTTPNIHRLGMKPVAQLPGYLKGLDVLLMPYRLNDATRHIYPLKLHEYLATGKPIVATPIPAVSGMEDLMYVAPDADTFERYVSVALLERDRDLAERRRRRARVHSWEAHVGTKSAIVERRLPAAGPGG
jgi:glycosyltransferase involved in cell wall biosynthesis